MHHVGIELCYIIRITCGNSKKYSEFDFTRLNEQKLNRKSLKIGILNASPKLVANIKINN